MPLINYLDLAMWMVLYGNAQEFMAQMITIKGDTCGMSWWVFSNIGGYHGAAWGILILFAFLMSVRVRQV